MLLLGVTIVYHVYRHPVINAMLVALLLHAAVFIWPGIYDKQLKYDIRRFSTLETATSLVLFCAADAVLCVNLPPPTSAADLRRAQRPVYAGRGSCFQCLLHGRESWVLHYSAIPSHKVRLYLVKRGVHCTQILKTCRAGSAGFNGALSLHGRSQHCVLVLLVRIHRRRDPGSHMHVVWALPVLFAPLPHLMDQNALIVSYSTVRVRTCQEFCLTFDSCTVTSQVPRFIRFPSSSCSCLL